MTSSTDLARQDEEASTLIERCGYAAAALTLIPFPIAETVGVAAVHAGMVVGLARIHGVTLSAEHAAAMVLRIGGTIGVSYVGTRVVLGLAKVVLPVLPGLIGAPLVFCSTLGIGAVVGATFAAGEAQQELSDDQVRAIYKDALAGAKARFDPRKVAEPSARAAAEAAVSQVVSGPAATPPPVPVTTPPAPRSPFESAVSSAPPTAPTPARPTIDAALAAVKTDRLTRLRRLRDDGVLLDSEYDAACKQLDDEA
jgi:uncharacterized protein (DUF697 family)